MKLSPAASIIACLLLNACGSPTASDLADEKIKYRIACDIRVNQWTPGQGQLLQMIEVRAEGKKTYTDLAKLRADEDELFKVKSAADQKCSAEGALKVNVSACSQVSSFVTKENFGTFNTFNINNGQSTGFYQCQPVLAK